MAVNPNSVIYAGYGCYRKTYDVTGIITTKLRNGQTTIHASNDVFGDPAPGDKKYLYVVWKEGDLLKSGVTGEGDNLNLG
ncbi:hypothetical protein GJ688_19380 [Heliobacillus mobilis]|uniref:Uncharacterized protein n=1 Tax=Heliobacterium mobile TaxID=28064 RepID=A0A6I3SPV4_HELMO|nr:hypothetical protein [Heliobacterium mobile]MTV51061.1 hypothetical protein [Heliobacterium mobile]